MSAHSAASQRRIRYEVSGSLENCGLPGAHSDLLIRPTGSLSKGPYTIVLTLMRPGLPPSPPDVVVGHERITGSSQILFQAPGEEFETCREIQIQTADGVERIVEACSNSEGRLGKLYIRDIVAASYEDARRLATSIMHSVISNISLMYDVPLETFRTDVIDQTTGNQHITIRMPYSTGVWNTRLILGKALNECSALYREALGSNSDFYALLCLYKIIETIRALQRNEASAAVQGGKPPLRRPREVTPESDDNLQMWASAVFPQYYRWGRFELGNVAPKEARGEKFSVVLDRYLLPLRNSIAHGLLDKEGLINVDDPDLQYRVRYWLPYMRVMTRRLMFGHFFPDTIAAAQTPTSPDANNETQK